jgi:Ca2+-binding EF-hand superfamily protein
MKGAKMSSKNAQKQAKIDAKSKQIPEWPFAYRTEPISEELITLHEVSVVMRKRGNRLVLDAIADLMREWNDCDGTYGDVVKLLDLASIAYNEAEMTVCREEFGEVSRMK